MLRDTARRHGIRSTGAGLLLLSLLLLSLAPRSATAQEETGPVDTVTVLSQPGQRPYECCHTLIVTNRQPDSVPISQVRVRLLDYNGEFIPGQAGAPGDWSIFLNRRDIQWISQTFEAEIDSGESLTSFRFCVRDTGVYRIRWETHGPEGLMSFDTLTFVCGSRDNCDEVFFSPIPSSNRCGFDIDLLNQNGAQQKVNDFHLQILTTGVTFDTAGTRTASGWRIQSRDSRKVEWRATGEGLSTGQAAIGFRVFMNASSGPVRVVWWTTNFGDVICRDTVTISCGLTVSDTLWMRPALSGDTCCRDLLLINTHFPRSPISTFRLAMTTPNARFLAGAIVPTGWSISRNGAGDTLLVTTGGRGLEPGDSLLLREVCYNNDLAPTDSVRFFWQTLHEGILVTNGVAQAYCRRKIVFCDSVSVRLDSSLTATSRCLTFRLENANSRKDVVRKFTLRISNPGVRRRIVSATPPPGWSLDRFTNDSVIFHRGLLEPGFDQDGFTFCLNLDTNALDPLTVVWTTWQSEVAPICTDSLSLDVGLRIACDTLRVTENAGSIGPLCCFDVMVRNTNSKGIPIDRIVLGVPRVDIYVDTATAETGNWRVGNTFPSVSITYLGDTIRAGDSALFTFCINATGVSERPFSFDVIWRTFGRGAEICFDTMAVVCQGAEGECDSISLTEAPGLDEGCFAAYQVDNLHTPDGPIDNVQFEILGGGASFVSAEGVGTASAFNNVDLTPSRVIFRGGTIPAGEAAGDFRLNFSDGGNRDIILEICTFEGDQELCCRLDTIECRISGVDDAERLSTLVHRLTVNPVTERMSVDYTLQEPGRVSLLLFNVQGEEILRHDAGLLASGEHRLVVDTDGLPAGVYRYLLQGGPQGGSGQVTILR